MRSIVICEKPSQARNVRDAVGDRYGKVMALRGHVIKLAEPEDVNPDWKQWGFQLLRPTSGFYPLNPDSSDGKGQLIKDIGEALQSADRVIIATDCDREGQGIGENVLRWFKYKGPVFRAIFNKEDPASLREAFEALRPNADFLSQYQAWVARAQVDQIANLSATRAATLALKPEGMKGAIGIGRVRTPTMAIVCRRQLEIDNFTPKTYWDLWVEVERNGETVRLHHKPGSSARIFAQAEAEKFLASMSGWRGSVVIDRESKRQKPPKFMDLPTLQIKAAQWGWSASKTLEIAQSLYETHKMTTYPRAESRYLPEVEAGNAPVMLAGLQTLELAPANYPEPEIRKGKGGCFSDKQLEGSSHHAIIPNVKTSDDWQAVYGRLNVDEKTLFDFIARNYLAAIGPDRLFERTEIALDFDNRKFATVGIVETDAGWRQVFSEPDEDDNLSDQDSDVEAEGQLPDWANGDAVSAVKSGSEKKTTKPPPYFSEGSLVKEMTEAWRYADNETLAARLKEAKGIGTPATRASIISGLISQGLLEVKKGRIHASELALGVYQELSGICPEFLDPAATAEMEMRLDAILRGESNPRQVIDDILQHTTKLLVALERRGTGNGLAVDVKQPPSAKLLAAAKSKAERQGVRLPRGATTDARICREFLGPRPEGNAPSEAQIKFAREIAASATLDLPDELLEDRKSLSEWISLHADKRPKIERDDTPSEAQIALAERISQQKNLSIPAADRKSRSALSKWIDKNSNGGKRKSGRKRRT